MAPVFKMLFLVALSLSVQFANACTWDSDCDSGYHCNDATKKCTMGKWPDGGCTWDSDCLPGYECEKNECQSTGTAEKTFIQKLPKK